MICISIGVSVYVYGAVQAAPMEPGSPTTPQPSFAHKGSTLPTTPQLSEVLQRRATLHHVDPTASPDTQVADADASFATSDT